ncbi:MAG TPA: glycosyltransferase family 92 protein [Acidimicrobiales bacterium]|nr:glycosyltransferase family 92 protein [Acidimicrobiales bacterium]
MRSLRAQVKTNRLLRAALFEAQNVYHASPFAGRALRRIDPAEGAPRHFLSAMIRVKDEARFLPEWLAHHLNVGVEHVYVYDNNSSDDIERVIMPFIERGLVTYVPWPTVPASPSSNNHFLTELGPSSEWVAFFDADELLVEDTPGALLEALGAAVRVPAIAVNGHHYGSSGHEVVPPGLVTATFTRADATPNQHVKVIARPAMVRRYRNSHNSYYRRGRVARTPAGRRVHGSFVTPDLPARLVLNHYVYRSREDYERKSSHGFVDAAGAADQARRTSLPEAEFGRHNDVEVTLPEPVLRATAALLRELGYPEQLYDGAALAAGRGTPGTALTD